MNQHAISSDANFLLFYAIYDARRTFNESDFKNNTKPVRSSRSRKYLLINRNAIHDDEEKGKSLNPSHSICSCY